MFNYLKLLFSYLNFDCYNAYKYRFLDRYYRSLKEAYEAPVKDYISKLSGDKDKFKKLYNELGLYLSDDHVHSSECKNFICCRYMSYLVHKEIRKLNNTICDQKTFKEFQNFSKMLTQKIGANTCEQKFDYLTTEEIDKMQMLYTLYDYYNGIKHLNVNKVDEKNKLCSTLALFVKTFNNINVDLLKEDEFNRKLEDLKELMKSKHEWATNSTCSSNLKSIRLKRIDPPPERVLPNHNEQQLALTDPLTSEVVKGQKTDLEPHVAPESEIKSELEEASRLHTASTSNGLSGLRDSLGSNNILGREEEFKSSRSTELGSRQKTIEMLKRSQERELTGIHTDLSFYRNNMGEYRPRDSMDEENLVVNLPTPPNDQEGVLVTMKNTLSSIVQNVDPVPVVGVSGGMGALFLLFEVLEILNLHPLCTIHLNKN
ncbi:hypothetical protein PVNG_05507 [Plasmodium vivax North Korean]|uniref:Uncharacterized protein n=1 Tax=Plasmodium vivax North Korean TaxID=1035514 RepID=A0A0J9U1Q0_PLAVI|nr:hypothetical protein PVNG_05507 [Plasmodium vivax North Korean]